MPLCRDEMMEAMLGVAVFAAEAEGTDHGREGNIFPNRTVGLNLWQVVPSAEEEVSQVGRHGLWRYEI